MGRQHPHLRLTEENSVKMLEIGYDRNIQGRFKDGAIMAQTPKC